MGSVESLDGVTFFRVTITTSHILQVSCTVCSTVNEDQPGPGAAGSSAMGRKVLMEIKVPGSLKEFKFSYFIS